jgi:hypothetical protein
VEDYDILSDFEEIKNIFLKIGRKDDADDVEYLASKGWKFIFAGKNSHFKGLLPPSSDDLDDLVDSVEDALGFQSVIESQRAPS